jgi:DNA repair exonuclease SbcCD ATPase subunit
MSDGSYDDQSDDGFEAEMDEARQAQEQDDAGGDEGEADDAPAEKPAVSKDVEKLERVAADKSRMAHAERRQRQAAEARAEALEARLAALEGRGRGNDDVDLSAIPDVETDPIGNIEALRKIALKLTQREQETQRATQAQTAQQRQFQQINARMQEYEADFIETNPDYNDAAKHFREARILELQEQGYDGDELTAALTTELVGLVARSLQSGKDPAEVVYKLAKNRGFSGVAGKSNPAQVDKLGKRLETIDRGQKASRSLSGMSGKMGDGELSAESVTRLEGAAFDAAFAKLRSQQRRAG